MALQKFVSADNAPPVNVKPSKFCNKTQENAQLAASETCCRKKADDVDIDLREVYFLIMHFLSAGPCQQTYGHFWNELLEHQLLPRRYHAWYSRKGAKNGNEGGDGSSFPLSYSDLVERYPHIEKNHLVKLLKQLLLNAASPSQGLTDQKTLNAYDVPTLLGTGSFSLLSDVREKGNFEGGCPPCHMRWPHRHADQVRGLSLREIGGGFTRHHRAPSVRAACYAIAKPSTMVQKMQNVKRLRGHRNAVYCAIFDRSGRYVITGSDDRLVKIWSMETAFCLASCRGHDGDITDLAVSSNNALVASASNDCVIRVWRLPDGQPISVLRGHTGAVTAIAFSPRPGSVYQLLSSSDDGTCRIWDARSSNFSPRIYVPKPSDSAPGRNAGPSSSNASSAHQIFCCAFNANGTVFVTGSSDNLARVWNACKPNSDDSDQPNHEIDVLSGHENDVNYVQFSGCGVPSRFSSSDSSKEESVLKFKNSWFSHENIVTCSRDGSAIIWIPRLRRSHGKAGRWTRAYHLKVPPPPMPPQPPRGGPRQRILPTPRGVSMIIWSLDNRFVLAAIMDCRICVWNAANGSIVHSLTGHTASTYVLDVHPFNPRIAMSAGYDGRTIVWDIWEGKPIRTYEISRFKLVDGKFSPDGTSIILSDDVGQLYILSTGQGESQNDAKYDQFFLGDYRPMIQDTHGNMVDQETQIIPYRRNMQDLLCDSGMNPYPEPYQSMFQKRRLGALGLEWKPSSLRLSAGPDFNLDPEYSMFLADLDVMIEPLPEFVDAMDWEPENQVVISDDADSEYNGAEEYSSGEEQGSANSLSSCDPGSSAEESDIEGKDSVRRSKRKKQKAEMEVMTSSGRRVKRRNLDECEGNSVRMSRKKSRSSRKTSKKSSKSKALRPQRAAARNALTLFSKITGRPTDVDDEDGSDGDSSESDSMMQYSSSESDESLQAERDRNRKGKEVLDEEDEDLVKSNEIHSSNMHSGSRKRLVLKLPVRDSNRTLQQESSIREVDSLADLDWASPRSSKEFYNTHGSSSDQGSPFGNANGGIVERKEKEIEYHYLDLKGCINGDIRWGGAKVRTSKRQKLADAVSSVAGSMQVPDDHNVNMNDLNGMKNKEDNSPPPLEVGKCVEKIDESVLMSGSQYKPDYYEVNHLTDSRESEKQPGLDELPKLAQMTNGDEDSPELKASLEPSTMLRLKVGDSVEKQGNDESGETEDIQQNPVLIVSEHDQTSIVSPDCKVNGLRELDSRIDSVSESGLNESTPSESCLQPKKMFDNVYRRSKTSKNRVNTLHHGVVTNINLSNQVLNANGELNERITDRECRAHSSTVKVPADDPDTGKECDSEEISRLAETDSPGKRQLLGEEWGPSSSKTTVGLRSTRNRRISYHFRDTSPVSRRKPHQPSKKESWLMFLVHEEGSRYIPQLGDEVAYLRQGHQEYIFHSFSKEAGPWRSAKGNIRAVEFCKIEGLEYSTLPGSGDACCKLTLKFVDPDSAMFGKSFKLTLPEITEFPDFLVERTRFEAAMQRNWTHRDKCRVWWKNEGEEDGSWWTGRIVNVKAKSPEFPDSPWERFTVQYKNDPSEKYPHSPWELFDADTQWEQPCIEDETRNKLLSAFAKLEKTGKKDYYGVEKLMQVSDKSNFTNRFPVPLSFQVIHSRLENNYYRSLEAAKHDTEVMLSNAESYFAKNAEVSAKMKRLSDFFDRTFSSL